MEMDKSSIGFKERVVVTPAAGICQEEFHAGKISRPGKFANHGSQTTACFAPENCQDLARLDPLLDFPNFGGSSVPLRRDDDLRPGGREQFGNRQSLLTSYHEYEVVCGEPSLDATENDLQDVFAAFGPVTEVNLIMDRATGRSRGFGFVSMATPEAAQAAITGMASKDFKGRTLTVNEARPREERSGGGGGDRGRGPRRY